MVDWVSKEGTGRPVAEGRKTRQAVSRGTQQAELLPLKPAPCTSLGAFAMGNSEQVAMLIGACWLERQENRILKHHFKAFIMQLLSRGSVSQHGVV